MALVQAGIYSRPAGKAGGIVWGAARTPSGKVATAREYVVPTNPDTVAQQHQRLIFRTAAALANNAGLSLLDPPWNNAIGLLPAWQSFMSHALRSLEWDAGLSKAVWMDDPPTLSLGPCYMPVMTATGGAGALTVEWPTDIVGDHCDELDELYGLVFMKDSPNTGGEEFFEIAVGNHHRSEGSHDFHPPFVSGETFEALLWWRHSEADGTYTYSPVAQVYADTT